MSTAARWLVIVVVTFLAAAVAGAVLLYFAEWDLNSIYSGGLRWGVLAVSVVEIGVAVIALVRLRNADPGLLRSIAGYVAFLLLIGGIDGVIGALTGGSLFASRFGVGLAWAIALGVITVLLFALLRFILGHGAGIVGVARTVVDEAIRLKIALVFMVILLLLLPVLPFTVGTDDPVRYRVQQFLGYGQTLTLVMLSLMTIFLACWTLTSEVADKQIFTLATKPISRGAYILGKWLGIFLLNGVLLAVAGLAIYGFTVFYLAQLPPHNRLDEIELNQRVLVARVSAAPHPAEPFEEQAQRRLETMLRESPGTIRELGQAYATELGLGAVGEQEMMALGAQRAIDQLVITAQTEWMSIGPLQTQTYIFEGLQNAARFGTVVQWRYKASTTASVPDDALRVMLRVNGTVLPDIAIPAGTVQEVPIPVDVIGPDGVLKLEVRHFNPRVGTAGGAYPTTISFRPDEMRMLFQVGTFGPNFLRAMLVGWIKLGFLAMLGLFCATFLSFAVAAITALIVYGGAVLSPFVLESLGGFGGRDEGAMAVVKGVLSAIAYVVSKTLGAWGAYSPGSMIVDGLYFGWDRVLLAALWIGVVWTGLAGLGAWLIFRRRELARVQV